MAYPNITIRQDFSSFVKDSYREKDLGKRADLHVNHLLALHARTSELDPRARVFYLSNPAITGELIKGLKAKGRKTAKAVEKLLTKKVVDTIQQQGRRINIEEERAAVEAVRKGDGKAINHLKNMYVGSHKGDKQEAITEFNALIETIGAMENRDSGSGASPLEEWDDLPASAAPAGQNNSREFTAAAAAHPQNIRENDTSRQDWTPVALHGKGIAVDTPIKQGAKPICFLLAPLKAMIDSFKGRAFLENRIDWGTEEDEKAAVRFGDDCTVEVYKRIPPEQNGVRPSYGHSTGNAPSIEIVLRAYELFLRNSGREDNADFNKMGFAETLLRDFGLVPDSIFTSLVSVEDPTVASLTVERLADWIQTARADGTAIVLTMHDHHVAVAGLNNDQSALIVYDPKTGALSQKSLANDVIPALQRQGHRWDITATAFLIQ